MENTIENLLLKNNSLIIPGFGSLIKSLSTGKITFNEFLKFNDGVLEKELMTLKGIGKEAAKKQIHEFSEKVNTSLKGGTNFKLGALGAFKKNDKGATIFEGKVAKGAAPKVAPIVALAPKPSVAKKISEKKPEEKSLNEKLAEKKPKEKSINEKQETKEETKKTVVPPPVKKETKKEEKQVISKPVTMSSSSGHGEHDENYVHLTQDEIEARHKKVALRGTIIFGILAIVVIAFFNFINPHHEHGEEGHGHDAATEEHGHDHGAAAAEGEDTAPAEVMEEEMGTEETEVKEEANASSPTSGNNASANGDPTNPAMEQSIPVNNINEKFYVISAAFSNEKKAKRQARLLMIMDYEALVISPQSGKYYACTGGYSDYQEAQKALAEYKAKKADAWLYTP